MKCRGLSWFDPEETDAKRYSSGFLPRTNILMGVFSSVGIEASDLTSLLEQFEETQGQFPQALFFWKTFLTSLF